MSATSRARGLLAALVTAAACAREAPPPARAARLIEDVAVVVLRGEKTLLGASYGEPFWRKTSYESLWKVWGLSARPRDFEEQALARYGLHRAPYDNAGLPMGLHVTRGTEKGEPGITFDCKLGHSAAFGS